MNETIIISRYLNKPTGGRPVYHPDPVIHKQVTRWVVKSCIECGREFERPSTWRKTVKCPSCGNVVIRHTRQPQVISLTSSESPKAKGQGFIYLILVEIEQFRFYKIGRTKNPIQRSGFFEVKLPFDFEIIHLFPADNMAEAEKKLHKRFADQRGNGEWFRLEDNDIAWIQAISKYHDGNFC